ncbi:MAG: tetratricopeptide repeat protein [Elusimicrobiota bacterium]|nr:tetratricopeptide repeat protein [Elusimicrobiota bacterium]
MEWINKKIICIGLVTIVLCLWSGVSFGDFDELGVGARPVGMGSAFVGLVDDVHSLYYNPAGLSQLEYKQFTSGYGRLFWGLDDGTNLGNTFVGYAHPLKRLGGIGVGWLNLGLSGLYQEDTFILSYGNKLFSSLSAGLNLKLLYKRYNNNQYTKTDPLFQEKGYSKIGFSVDFGLLYNFAANIFSGLCITDIVQPDMNLGEREGLPLGVRTGIAYRDKVNLINLALDAGYEDGEFNISAGAEKWLSGKSVGVRGGIDIGSNGFKSFSLGGSCQVSALQIDYAFIYPLFGLRETYGSHRFSVTLRFGSLKKTVSEKEGLIPRETGIPETSLSEEENIEEMRRYYYRGMDYYERGEYEAAIAEFEKVLQLKPDHSQSLRLIERAKERMKIRE